MVVAARDFGARDRAANASVVCRVALSPASVPCWTGQVGVLAAVASRKADWRMIYAGAVIYVVGVVGSLVYLAPDTLWEIHTFGNVWEATANWAIAAVCWPLVVAEWVADRFKDLLR